jgi:hypothetical protein
MPQPRRYQQLTAGLFAVCLLPTTASAQSSDLRTPTIAATAAATADWVSTYHTLKHYRTHETNPLLRPFQDSPGQLVLAGAIIDVGAVTAWNLTVGRKKPKVAAAGLWVMTAFRSYLSVHNLRNAQKAGRR